MIEDVDFLYQNSRKENLIILVDSSKRDYTVYPNVAEFQINFPQPFNLVYGIDILNTTIPRTQFMVEDYNNSVMTRAGFNILSKNVEDVTYHLMSQDFTSPSAFVQRLNDQLNPRYVVDNYDNVIYDDKFSKRGAVDYPIIRLSSSMSPFLLNMSHSSANKLLGFDCLKSVKSTIKYNTITNVLNSYCPLRCHSLEYTEPYEIFSIKTKTNVVRSTNTISIRFVYSPTFKGGSFLQKLELNTNKLIDYSEGNFKLSIHDVTDDRVFVSPMTIKNDMISQNKITLTRFVEDPNTHIFGGTNNHFVLKHGNEYNLTIENVYDKSLNILQTDIGLCYFYELQNINVNDNIFLSRTIVDPDAVINVLNIATHPESSTLCTNIFPVTFPLHIGYDMTDTFFNVSTLGMLSSFHIEVKQDSHLEDVKSSDPFVLRITRKALRMDDLVIGEDTVLCEACMTLNTQDDKQYIGFELEDIQSAYFSQIQLLLGVDQSSLYDFECVLFASKPINIVGVDGSYSYKYSYQNIDHFGIVSPGMMNLTADNYVLLRCPEIENHLKGSYNVNDDNEPGMGVLNIDVQGYASGRMDFFSVIYKEFHPIGKLDKMTFRFERKSDRQLYDFKNVNLHFLMSIKFLRPIQKQKFEQSKLNPNYNPNYLGYINKTLQDGYDDNSSDDDDEMFSYEEHELAYHPLREMEDDVERRLRSKRG